MSSPMGDHRRGRVSWLARAILCVSWLAAGCSVYDAGEVDSCAPMECDGTWADGQTTGGFVTSGTTTTSGTGGRSGTATGAGGHGDAMAVDAGREDATRASGVGGAG